MAALGQKASISLLSGVGVETHSALRAHSDIVILKNTGCYVCVAHPVPVDLSGNLF